jgi:hypothetical protein
VVILATFAKSRNCRYTKNHTWWKAYSPATEPKSAAFIKMPNKNTFILNVKPINWTPILLLCLNLRMKRGGTMPGQRWYICAYLTTISTKCQYLPIHTIAIHAFARLTRIWCPKTIRQTIYIRHDTFKRKFNIKQNIFTFYFFRICTLLTPSALWCW